MQISGLPASNTLNLTDVFAKDTSGTTTEKINAQNLAAGIGVLGGLTSIKATGTTNTTGAAITTDNPYFYLNGVLVKALTNIASGATFTNGTNYEVVTAGGLNSLNNIGNNYYNSVYADGLSGDLSLTVPNGTYMIVFGGVTQSSETTCTLAFNNANAWEDGFLSIVTPPNPNANFTSTERTILRTFTASSNTITVSYSTNWYRVYMMAIRIKA